MLRFLLSAVVLTGFLAASHPARTDHAVASNAAQPRMDRRLLAPAGLPSDATRSPNEWRGKDIPVGFGWG